MGVTRNSSALHLSPSKKETVALLIKRTVMRLLRTTRYPSRNNKLEDG